MKLVILFLITFLSVDLFAKHKDILKLLDEKQWNTVGDLQTSDGSSFIKEASTCSPLAPQVACLRLYANQKYVVAELCSDAGSLKSGIYIKSGITMKHFAWYDSKYANWACKETCNDLTKCSFSIDDLKKNQISKMTFAYEINMQGGRYQLAIAEEKIKVLNKKDIDLGP